MFSRDLAPTEIVEALEADRLMELASLDFRPTETSEDFLDVVVGFVLATGSASLEALLVLFLLVTLTEDVVLTSFCSFDSFRVLAALCLARVAEEDVLNSCASFPLTLLLLLLLPPAWSTDFFLVVFLSTTFSPFSGSFGVGSVVWPPFG